MTSCWQKDISRVGRDRGRMLLKGHTWKQYSENSSHLFIPWPAQGKKPGISLIFVPAFPLSISFRANSGDNSACAYARKLPHRPLGMITRKDALNFASVSLVISRRRVEFAVIPTRS